MAQHQDLALGQRQRRQRRHQIGRAAVLARERALVAEADLCDRDRGAAAYLIQGDVARDAQLPRRGRSRSSYRSVCVNSLVKTCWVTSSGFCAVAQDAGRIAADVFGKAREGEREGGALPRLGATDSEADERAL